MHSGPPAAQYKVQTVLEVRQLLPASAHVRAIVPPFYLDHEPFKPLLSGTLSASQNAQLLGSVYLQSNAIRISILSNPHLPPPPQSRISPLPSTQHEGRSRHIVGLRARLLRRP